jgi:hypothetical protein
MIYTHVLNRGGRGVINPLDRLGSAGGSGVMTRADVTEERNSNKDQLSTNGPPYQAQSQLSAPPVWYSVTRVSKKFFSFLRSIISAIQGNGLSALSKS